MISKHALVVNILNISCEIPVRLMPQVLIDDNYSQDCHGKLTLVMVHGLITYDMTAHPVSAK